MRAEGNYAEMVTKLRNEKENKSLMAEAKKKATEYGLLLGKSETESLSMLERDIQS